MTTRLDHQDVRSALTSQQIWRALVKASFAVLSHVTPSGEPRSSGVVYWANAHRLYVAVATDSWKAKQIAVNGRVAVTVPVRRGGLLSLLLPIPPAVIGFHGTATVHPAGSPEARSTLSGLGSLLPPESRDSAAVVEIVPEGEFVTYGLNVPLRKLRDPAAAQGRAPMS